MFSGWNKDTNLKAFNMIKAIKDIYIYIYIYTYIYTSLYVKYKQKMEKQNYLITRYQNSGKYLRV